MNDQVRVTKEVDDQSDETYSNDGIPNTGAAEIHVEIGVRRLRTHQAIFRYIGPFKVFKVIGVDAFELIVITVISVRRGSGSTLLFRCCSLR